MEADRAVVSGQEETLSVPRAETPGQPRHVDGDSLCPPDGHPLGGSAPGDGLRQWHDLLAPAARLAEGGHLEQRPPSPAARTPRGRPDRLVPGGGGFEFHSRRFWGAQTGPNPTDRRKKGTKHHVLTSANGIPLAARITGANRNDITQLLPLVDAVPPVAGKVGRPRRRPKTLYGDRAYDSQPHRNALRRRGIVPFLARRRTEHGSGLGVYRWVVERTIAWLRQYRRLRVRYERRADIHEALVQIGCIMICWNFLSKSFC